MAGAAGEGLMADDSFETVAIVYSQPAPTAAAAETQQLRWEGGKLHVARTQIPRLLADAVRKRRLSLLDAAFEQCQLRAEYRLAVLVVVESVVHGAEL